MHRHNVMKPLYIWISSLKPDHGIDEQKYIELKNEYDALSKRINKFIQ